MNPQAPLANMHDIIVPTFQADWWPLPFGYWFTASLLLIAIGYTVWRYRRRQQRLQAMRLALQELAALQNDAVNDMNQLVKRVAIHYHGRQAMASLTGQAWMQQLKQWVKPSEHALLTQWHQQQYQATPSAATNHKTLVAKIIQGCSQAKSGVRDAVI
jgi:hypothetical protein